MSTPTGVQGITEADIANYLANTPGFFERQAELLASVQLTSPHGHRAVSLQQRQMEMLRDKIRGLEYKIVEMIRNGQENVAIADRLHRWTHVLMRTERPAELPDALVRELMHQFLIPQAAVRVWDAAPAFAALDFARPVSDDLKQFAGSLALPYCGINGGFEAANWLDDSASAKSIALLPLRRDDAGAAPAWSANPPLAPTHAFGMLVLASPDPTRYTAEMGTEFLVRIAETAGAALSRVLPAHA